jgi:hypothetical protein
MMVVFVMCDLAAGRVVVIILKRAFLGYKTCICKEGWRLTYDVALPIDWMVG